MGNSQNNEFKCQDLFDTYLDESAKETIENANSFLEKHSKPFIFVKEHEESFLIDSHYYIIDSRGLSIELPEREWIYLRTLQN